MDASRDFIKCLGQDMSLKILMCLEDPSDLVRTSAVSRSWRQFGEFTLLNYCLFDYCSLVYYAFLLNFLGEQGP